MGTVDRYPAGSFCWIELGSGDLEASKVFYGELFGWRFEDLQAGGEPYTVAQLDGMDVCGLDQDPGVTSVGWQSFIAVRDMDAVIAAADAAGAAVYAHKGDLPFASRFAVLDVAGTSVTLWQLEPHHGARLVNEVRTWNWNELVTPDLHAVAKTYATIFGWTVEPIGGQADRISFRQDGRLIAGGHAPMPGESATPRWEVSFRVADADQAAARVQALDGKVILPPLEIPVGKLAIVADPDGNAFMVTTFEKPFGGVDGS
jgi:predicted enzyme related to lactoylglutathione lyase